MNNKLSFTPKILLCGEESDFLLQIGNRPVQIVGRVQVTGKINTGGGINLDFAQDGKFLFNDELKDSSFLKDFLQSGAADYFIFTDPAILLYFRRGIFKFGFGWIKIITLEYFKTLPSGFLYNTNDAFGLLSHINTVKLNSLLDVDGYLVAGRLFTKLGNETTDIDAIIEKPLPPIATNVYKCIYKSFTEIGFRRYTAVLIAERTPADFNDIFNRLENISDMVITFAQNNSELEKHLTGKGKNFDLVESIPTNTGKWYFLNRFKPPQDFAVYVVTHKPTPHEGKLPAGYKIIQAGHALNPDLGYIGDDIGDNISKLNPYINELTALYWMWKNTTHSVIGLCHYRRFFTDARDARFAYEKILTQKVALGILESYDIILFRGCAVVDLVGGIVINSRSTINVKIVQTILKKHLLRTHADYLDAFESVFTNIESYDKNMFITRRNIFNAYCEWLFSFLLDATEEILETIPLKEAQGNSKRLIGFFAEYMFTVWLMKHNLRIKELNIMTVPGI